MSVFSKQPKHAHQWKIVGGTFEPPVLNLISVKNVSDEMMLMMAHGFTTLTQQCETCGWVSASRVVGKPDLAKLGFNWPSKQPVS